MASEDERPFQLPRPEQLEALSPDQVVAVVLRLAMELSVLRDRLRTHEQLLAEHNLLSPESVDSYLPSKEEATARMDAGRRLIEQIISDLST
ncbi:MAG: hypothetical protein AAF552_01495 [Pseudomonadota bacterium]